jgi:hypothetical protein
VSESKDEGGSNGQSSGPNATDSVKPFRDASTRFVQAKISAQQTVVRDRMLAHLDFQEAVRKVEQDSHNALLEAVRKHMKRISEPASDNVEEIYMSRMQSHMEYENEVRQVYADAQSRLQDITQRSFGPSSDDIINRFTTLQQAAYQKYLTELQQAWSGTTELDPQAVKAVATNMLCALNTY